MFNIEKYREIKGFLKKTTDIIAISKNHPIESVEKAIKMGVKIFGEILRHCADIRRLGSAALDICWLAAGRLDVYYESLNLWDFAAARLIASEAGAVCGHFSEVPDGADPQFYENDLLITNVYLFPKIKEILRAANALK